ncbi:hypothetical protein Ddye_000514 [Dipteronia dyeriana]|uniref:Uncharacterized protein n=1 Tax=Dipteronia dyeriana TaxID=168575 RepID=A0AAD9XMI3_9ROSI|nr:hypothetical protein Ddye_000514 [Dipteronia dyeriana]
MVVYTLLKALANNSLIDLAFIVSRRLTPTPPTARSTSPRHEKSLGWKTLIVDKVQLLIRKEATLKLENFGG